MPIEYDSSGQLIGSTTTTDGVLVEECTYTTINGESVISQCVSYLDDGCRNTNDYDEYGNVIRLVSYDAKGNHQTMKYYSDDVLMEETIYNTVVTEEGSVTYPEIVTEYHEDGTQTVTTYDENGEVIS